MDKTIRTAALRELLIDDMDMCRFSRETQRNYLRDVGHFARSRPSSWCKSGWSLRWSLVRPPVVEVS